MILRIFIAILLFSSTVFARVITLTKNNTVPFIGEVNATSMEKVKSDLDDRISKRTNDDQTIYILIYSPGGNLGSMERLVSEISDYRNIATISLESDSAAAYFVEFVPFPRLITKKGSLMFHLPKYIINGKYRSQELAEFAEKMKQEEEIILTIFSLRSNQNIDLIRKNIATDWVIQSQEAIDLGFIDEIIQLSCNGADINNKPENAKACESLMEDLQK